MIWLLIMRSNMEMNRYDKLEWLEQTTSPQFMQETLVQEMVRWMGEDEFEQFYDHLCRMWGIARDQAEWDYVYCT